MHMLVLLVVGAAAISVAADVDSFSYPVLDANTTHDLMASINTGFLRHASLLFSEDRVYAKFNRTEGFLLHSRNIDVWRDGPGGGAPALEASFNTSFVLSSGTAAPVAFVVLSDSFPTLTLHGTGGLHGCAHYSASDAEDGATSCNTSGSLASVEAGPVRSDCPDSPAYGLNVTVTPKGTAAARTVWIEYHAAVHRLFVYVAGAGEARPAEALVDAPLVLAVQRTMETAMVGFAGNIQDILVGVRGWNLTVDRFDSPGTGGDGWKKGASWWVILLAVLGSVAAIVAAVVCYLLLCPVKARAFEIELTLKESC